MTATAPPPESALFRPLALRELALANRIMVSPMCMYSARDGCATAWHWAHLPTLALSGAALVCLEATAVAPEGRITPGCLGLWSDANEAALAPSAVPHAEHEPAPRALDGDDLARLRSDFASAAARAARLGFDAIELHMAHGYLLHQFLSPVANRRRDRYGGDFAGRTRFPLEVFDAVRAAFPSGRPVGVRVSATDGLEGEDAWTLAQTVQLAHALRARGCDWIDVSSGGISPRQKIAPAPGYQVPLAEAVRNETGMTTIAVGLISDAHQAEAIVRDGRADLVALARGILYDPRWAWHAAAELHATVPTPPQLWRALPRTAPPIFGDIALGQR